MAKAPNDAFITTGELKQALGMAGETQGGIPFALSMNKDGDGLLLAAKKGNPKKLLAELTKGAKDKKEELKPPKPFFGRAIVEAADQSKILFKVNKMPPANFRPAILKIIKPLTYTDFEFVLDEAIENEGEEVEQEAGDTGGGAAAQSAEPQQPEPSQIPAAPPPPPDMSGFRSELTALIPQITAAAGNDAGRADQMKKAAGAATVAIRGNDADAARTAIAALKALIGQAGGAQQASAPKPAAPGPAAPGKFVAMQKSRLIGESARRRVGGEVQSLKTAVAAAAKGDADETAVLSALNQLDDIMSRLDERLIEKLDAMLNIPDPNAHGTLLQEAKGILSEYVAYTQSSPLVQKLDGDTPFGVKLSIASTMTATLKALQTTIV